jgi:hypothetical protein
LYSGIYFYFSDKVAKIRAQLEKNADALVVSALDEVACMYFSFLIFVILLVKLINSYRVA